MTLISQADYARRIGISKAAISQWKKSGRLILQGALVDVEATDAYQKRYRRDGLPTANTEEKTVKRGRPRVKQAEELNSGDLNSTRVRLTLHAIREQLEVLDYRQVFDWSDAARQARMHTAATCIGWAVVEHPHTPGRYQLQVANGMGMDGVPVRGFNFELSAVDVLAACRDELVPEDGDWSEELAIRPGMLAALAQPLTL
jgi:transcriptional regulator with XRE-family HTH domain